MLTMAIKANEETYIIERKTQDRDWHEIKGLVNLANMIPWISQKPRVTAMRSRRRLDRPTIIDDKEINNDQ